MIEQWRLPYNTLEPHRLSSPSTGSVATLKETYSNSKVDTLFGGQGSNLKLQFMAHTKSGRGPL